MAGGIKMKKSRELNMSIPEITDKIDVREISENFEIIDKILSANLFKRNTSTTEINVTAYPPYYIMKNTENNPINYFDPIFEETFTLGPLEEKKFFINAPQSVYITSDVQIEYDYFIPVQEAINDISPGGTSDYDNLDNKPQINGNVLSGDKTASELGLADINDIPDISASAINGNIKINGTEINVYTHPTGTNPHGTTKSDVGLGNVPNVATNDQTPSYTEASSLAKLTSGEKLSISFGKISKAVTDLISHLADSVKHITSTERTNWNAAKTKADTNETNISSIVSYINNGDFAQDEEVKMVKTVPNDVKDYCAIKKIGGKTQKFNQICSKGTLTLNGSVADNYAYDSTTNTISFRFKGNNAGCYQRVTTKGTDKYYIRTTAKTTSTNSNVLIRIGLENSSSNKDTSLSANVAKTTSFICTPETKAIIFYFMNATSGDTCSIQNTMIINLTEMFGSGNEPTTEEFEATFPKAYYPYTEGELWNAATESVVSIGKNFSPINSKSVTVSGGGFLIGTTSNPQSINLFSGKYIISYNQTTSTGQTEFKFYDSIGNTISKTITNSSSVNVEITFDKPIVECTMFCNKPTTITNFMIRLYDTDSSYVPYNKTTLLIPDSIKSLPDYGVRNNYVDFENMKYHHIDSKRAYEDGDVDSDTVITDGVNETVYQLATEEVIDISDMLMPIRCESGGTITFQNEHNLDMPNTVVYKKEVSLT